ncbi:adenosylcobalamin-dependent ribonucleoside-diphosphate reductase [Candidatus Marinimicrobia bacterium MT.SAG.3]|nr:adenosylcobalamin-dependent ribonucleoside-diphosphate reductase [Candidatus Marinimicrobia bacterium MT.SAG.3]
MSSNISIDFQEPNKDETPITQTGNTPEPLPVAVKDSSTEKKQSKQTKESKESKQTYLLTEEELQLIKDKFYSEPEGGSLLADAMETNAYYPENDLAADVLRNKYLAPNEKGPLHLWHRVAKSLASVEENKEEWYEKFFEILKDFRFIPGGRVMHAAGREDARRRPTLSNCYVIPIKEDSLEGIYKCLSDSAMVYRTGGGVGTDLSGLRPQGARVNATVDSSPGVTAFMNLFSESTNTVSQAGRRGALMLTLRVDHPDIREFISIKSDKSRDVVKHANVSVLITHEFMEALLEDKEFDLRFGGKVYDTLNAKDLWDKIIRSAHASAEPGIIFWDTMKEYHNNEYATPLSSTNPCGEQPLPPFTACNLGNINLSAFVDENGEFDYKELKEVSAVATRFLDNVITYNYPNHALDNIKEAVGNDRRIGLGITALADTLIKMGIKYDTEEGLAEVDKIMKVLRDTAYTTSIDIAEEKGAYPLFDWDGYSKSKFVKSLPRSIKNRIKESGIRNCTLITVPPVGTGSIVAETSSGVEPIYQISYDRRVKNDDGHTFRTYKVFHPLITELFGSDENLPEWVVTAYDIDPFFRVKMQSVIQKYTDSSISSTVNLPEETPVETIADIYIEAYKAGLKGITVYREGSREGILSSNKAEASTDQKVNTEKKPDVDTANKSELNPRYRPAITNGVTQRVRTGEGNLYITINEDENGLCEVFTTIGKAGGNAQAQSEAISRMISLALRSGINPHEVIKQLKGISGPSPVWQDGDVILSTPDAIGKALEKYIVDKEHKASDPTEKKGFTFYENNPSEKISSIEFGVKSYTLCQECGSTMTHENGCMICKHCGFSKCF